MFNRILTLGSLVLIGCLFASATQAAIGGADLAIAMTIDNDTLGAGDTVLVTISVTNLGPQSTGGVQVVSEIPSVLSYTGGCQDATESAGVLTWGIGELAVLADVQCEFSFDVGPGPGSYLLAAAADGFLPDTAEENDVATILFMIVAPAIPMLTNWGLAALVGLLAIGLATPASR